MAGGQPGLQQFSSDATGAGLIEFGAGLTNVFWRFYQLTVACTPAGVFGVQLFINTFPVSSYRVGLSPACASGDPWIDVTPSTILRVQVSNGPAAILPYLVSYLYDELPMY